MLFDIIPIRNHNCYSNYKILLMKTCILQNSGIKALFCFVNIVRRLSSQGRGCQPYADFCQQTQKFFKHSACRVCFDHKRKWKRNSGSQCLDKTILIVDFFTFLIRYRFLTPNLCANLCELPFLTLPRFWHYVPFHLSCL